MDLTMSLLSNDLLGWIAALLTLMTFVCSDTRRLRLLALAANAAFIAYGALVPLRPVLALQLALVPVNQWRLNQTLRRDETALSPTPRAPARPRARQAWCGWTPRRRLRADTPRNAPTGTCAKHGIRPDFASANGPATQS